MSDVTLLCEEMKGLIIECLALEDVTASDIQTEDLLFGGGLDLDSIDALEIAMAIEERYNVTLDDDPETNQELFRSIRTLAEFVAGNQHT